MILGSHARGWEQEYSMNTNPPDAVGRRLLIDSALNVLHEKNYTIGARWRVSDETGNLDYERGISLLWAGEKPQTPQASNGMRVYDDSMHFEVSSPVYRKPWDAMVYSYVGEVLVNLACQGAAERFGIPVHAYKNNLSTIAVEGLYDSVAFGTHGNVLLSRQACNKRNWRSVRKALLPYMITRLPFVGGGDMVPVAANENDWNLQFSEGRLHGNQVRFAISPRVCFLQLMSSLDTTIGRGLLNERDEPHATAASYWRFHDINLEGVRSPFQLFLMDALEAFVMAAFDAGLLADAPEVSDPLKTAIRLSLTPDLRAWRVRLENGKEVHALQDILLGYYLNKVGDLVEAQGSLEDKRVLDVLTKVVEKLSSGDTEAFAHGFDWVTKSLLITEYDAKEEDALNVCNQYALIDDTARCYLGESVDLDKCDSLYDVEASLVFAQEWLPWCDWSGLAAAVRSAMYHGPSDTREYLRSWLFRKFPEEIQEVSWAKLYFEGAEIHIPEPFRGTETECAGLDRNMSLSQVLQQLKELGITAEQCAAASEIAIERS